MITEITNPSSGTAVLSSVEFDVDDVSCLSFAYTGTLEYLSVSVLQPGVYWMSTGGPRWTDVHASIASGNWRQGQVGLFWLCLIKSLI